MSYICDQADLYWHEQSKEAVGAPCCCQAVPTIGCIPANRVKLAKGLSSSHPSPTGANQLRMLGLHVWISTPYLSASALEESRAKWKEMKSFLHMVNQLVLLALLSLKTGVLFPIFTSSPSPFWPHKIVSFFGAGIVSYWQRYHDISAKRMNNWGSLLTENEKELLVP